MISFSRRFNVWLTVAALGAWCLSLCSCVSLGKKDAFPVAGQPFSLPSLQALADPGGTVRPLPVVVGGHPVAAYFLRHPGSRGVLLFIGGSANHP